MTIVQWFLYGAAIYVILVLLVIGFGAWSIRRHWVAEQQRRNKL